MDRINRRSALKAAGVGFAAAATPWNAEASESDQGTEPPPNYLILSCDGGGMRGVLTALIIKQLNDTVPFLDRVNLFAGTSTGAIIGLGLANGMKPQNVVDWYVDRGAEIFNRARPKPEPTGRIGRFWGSVKSHAPEIAKHLGFELEELLRSRYGNEGLQKALTDAFGDSTFQDLKPGRSALVTTLRLSSDKKSWAPLVLHNLPINATKDAHVEDGPTMSTRLVDAAMCSTAAPLYFPPHSHPEFGYCIDGGVFANCPASIALALADRANKGKNVSPRVLSIGTGAQVSSIEIPSSPFETPEEYGALAWLSPMARGKLPEGGHRTPAFPLISALLEASSASHSYVCKQALGEDYHRVQVQLAKSVPLDATDVDSRKRIHEAAEKLFAGPDWQATVAWLGRQLT
jgi:predicted acylesterase/phospholipase RssA